MKIGIIGGTGFYSIDGEEIEIETRYGKVIAIYFSKNGKDVFFIPRHGKKHVPAHKVNYHANITAMKNAGVDAVFGISTVGSMRRDMKPGDIFIPNDFIDFTKRKTTFFDDDAVHIDMSMPFCPVLRKILYEEASKTEEVHEGVYIATEGPRLETKAEIAMMSKFADVVGMTLVPEVILAREAGICYASLCLISNYASGLQSELSIEEIRRIYSKRKGAILEIVERCIERVPDKRSCKCRNAPIHGRLD